MASLLSSALSMMYVYNNCTNMIVAEYCGGRGEVQYNVLQIALTL